MREKHKAVSFLLVAAFVLCLSLTANAQTVFHTVSSTPTDVIQTGLSEVLGAVRLTVPGTPPSGTTVASTINFQYDVPITNLPAATQPLGINVGTGIVSDTRGITVTVTGGFINAGVQVTVSNNSTSAGQLTVSIPAGLTVAANDNIQISGVRGRITGKSTGQDVNVTIQANPSTAHSFVNVSVVRVSRANEGLTTVVTGRVEPVCNPTNEPTITITEGFPGAFVQHITSAGGTAIPADARLRYGANRNTQVRITVTNLPSGIGISWPSSIAGHIGSRTGALGSSTLQRISGSSTEAIYEFVTTSQGNSDLNTEVFFIGDDPDTGDANTTGYQGFNVGASGLTGPYILIPPASGFGQASAFAQLWPDEGDPVVGSTGAALNAIATRRPSFIDPPEGGNFINVSKCITYLLFPFMTNKFGYDSGMAIANTSADGDATAGPFSTQGAGAPPQSGGIRIYGWEQYTIGGTAPTTTPRSYTITNLEAGNTWADSLSNTSGLGSTFAGFQGYIIAACDFQFAHGFAFISAPAAFGAGSGALAEGYLAVVLPEGDDHTRTTVAGEIGGP